MTTIACGTAGAHCQTLRTGTTAITFQSSTDAEFRQPLAREAATETVTVRANLDFPQEARDRYPTVVILHTIAGYRETNEGYAAAEFQASPHWPTTAAARATTGMAMSGSPAYLPAGVTDVYAALRMLASDPRIDVNRIAICCFLVWR